MRPSTDLTKLSDKYILCAVDDYFSKDDKKQDNKKKAIITYQMMKITCTFASIKKIPPFQSRDFVHEVNPKSV